MEHSLQLYCAASPSPQDQSQREASRRAAAEHAITSALSTPTAAELQRVARRSAAVLDRRQALMASKAAVSAARGEVQGRLLAKVYGESVCGWMCGWISVEGCAGCAREFTYLATTTVSAGLMVLDACAVHILLSRGRPGAQCCCFNTHATSIHHWQYAAMHWAACLVCRHAWMSTAVYLWTGCNVHTLIAIAVL